MSDNNDLKKVILFGLIAVCCFLLVIFERLNDAFPAVNSNDVGYAIIFIAAASISIAGVYAFGKED